MAMTGYFKVVNFEDFQHYNDRSPPWIKLYNRLLDDYEFSCLQDASKLHLILIWLLASRTNNRIPADLKWISEKIGAKSKVDLNGLLNTKFLEKIEENQPLQNVEQDASKLLQESKVSNHQERERETEREGERDKRKKESHPTKEEVIKYFAENKYTEESAIKAFEYYSAAGWKDSNGKVVKAWKQKMVGVWFKPENKIQQSEETEFQQAVKLAKKHGLEAFRGAVGENPETPEEFVERVKASTAQH